jgi:hypothetical protein
MGTGYHAMCDGAYKIDAKVPGVVTPAAGCVVKVAGVIPGKYDGATDKQNGLKLASSGKPSASGLAGSVFANAMANSTTAVAAAAAAAPAPAPALVPAASGAASSAVAAAASALLAASVLLALSN